MWTALLFSVALGADLDRFPLRAEVALDGPGAVRVPLGLRSPDDPDDGSDLLFVDGDGRVVPVAWARRGANPERVPLVARPGVTSDVFAIGALDRAIDGLDARLPDAGTAATVRVYEVRQGRREPLGEPTLVWQTAQASSERIELPSTRGPLQVELAWHARPERGQVMWTGLRRLAGDVFPDRETVPVVDTVLEEDGWVRYSVPLPAAWPVERLTVHAEGEVFDREAMVRSLPEPDPLTRWADGHLRRLRIGSAAVEETTLGVSGPPSDTLWLYVDARRGQPLPIPEVTVEVPGVVGLVPDPGPGPHTLYGGAPAGTVPPSELQAAIPELQSLAAREAEIAQVEANPAFVPPEIRGGLAGPGAPLEEREWTWRRPIQGSGLVRIPLDAHVVAHARSDHADLRVVDAQGRPIPHLRVRRPIEQPHQGVEVEREEDGSRSRLSITVAEPRIPVARLELATDAPIFTREVTVERARGKRLEPLRAFEWRGEDRPIRATLDLDALIGDRLVVTIENGSNPPLSITGVEATWTSWELVAWVPEGGASLWYGAPGSVAPRYDLEGLADDVIRRADTQALLGPPMAMEPPARTLWERLFVLFGLGVLALGLLGLTVSLLRAVPEDDESSEE